MVEAKRSMNDYKSQRILKALFYTAVSIALSSAAALAQEAEFSASIRTLGIGGGTTRLVSTGLDEGREVLASNNTINGSFTYKGEPTIRLFVVNKEGTPTDETYTIQLPDLKRILLVMLQLPSGQKKMFALEDDYGSSSKRTISVLNVTSMDMFIRLEEAQGRIAKGQIFRTRFSVNDLSTKLNVALVGDTEGNYKTLANGKIRMRPGTDVTIVITGKELTTDSTFANDQIELSTIYHPPVMSAEDVTNEDYSGDTQTIQIQGGDTGQ
jgi:hypothetical protein